jgi:hypothetical protein
MRDWLRRAVAAAATGLLLLVGAGVVAAAVAFSAGSVHIYVLEKKPGGDHVNLLVPASLVPLGVRFMPAAERQRVARRMEPWLPALRAAGRELARAPDCVLVEVESPRERVQIRKLGRSLLVHVDSEEETVRLSFPLKLVTRLADEFENSLPL